MSDTNFYFLIRNCDNITDMRRRVKTGGAVMAKDAAAALIPDVISECAIGVGADGVCASDKAVAHMHRMVQGSHTGKSRVEIVEAAKQMLGCDSERCVLESAQFKAQAGRELAEKEIRENLKVSGPTDVGLLNNFNIDQSLRQWMTKFTDPSLKFYAYNLNMLNFKEVGDTLHTIKISDLYAKGYRTFGCVINTDTYSGPGIHWMALFGDMRSRDNSAPWTVEFFNSSGNLPQLEYANWLMSARDQMVDIAREQSLPVKVEIVKCCGIEHQKSKTECGVYSLYYIYARLNGIGVDFFRTNTISDEVCFELRQHLFYDPSRSQDQVGEPFDYAKFSKSTRIKWAEGGSDSIAISDDYGDFIHTHLDISKLDKTCSGLNMGILRERRGKWAAIDIGHAVILNSQHIMEVESVHRYNSLKSVIDERLRDVYDGSAEDALEHYREYSDSQDLVVVLLRLPAATSEELQSRLFVNDEERAESKIEVPFDLELGADARELEFRRIPITNRFALHWSARSELLRDIAFLSEYGKLSKLVLTSAPHITYLAELFPNHKFVLYGNSKMRSSDRIEVLKSALTKDIAEKYAKAKVLFIGNDAALDELISALKPVVSLLRCTSRPESTERLYGKIWLRPWASQTEPEASLIVLGEHSAAMQPHDNALWLRQMHRHNTITRQWQKFEHGVNGEGIDCCWDCVAEVYILRQYLGSSDRAAIAAMSREISRRISRDASLVCVPHGIFKNTSMSDKCFTLYSRFIDAMGTNSRNKRRATSPTRTFELRIGGVTMEAIESTMRINDSSHVVKSIFEIIELAANAKVASVINIDKIADFYDFVNAPMGIRDLHFEEIGGMWSCR